MLFNSPVYLFLFLPIAFIGYYLISKYLSHRARNIWIILVSVFFYGFWNPVYIPILAGSVLVNFLFGHYLGGEKLYRKFVLVLGISLNVLLLGIFKYADFFITNVNWITGSTIPLTHIVLPLAISFFTFQQIAYLVDSYKRVVKEHSFINYAVFVTFFPQLIAGPIVHHSEMLPQFQKKESGFLNYKNISVGLFIILMGLVKKVGIADTFAVWSNAGHAYEGTLTFFDAWATSLSYTLQLYFDFSGYTDMAIGSALLFNINLPKNFNSPYKAVSIQDFWRRWHMTLSRFLRDYIYIPLGGNRHGNLRLYTALLIVFLIGGIWHGPSWTFVIWGALHGVAAIIHRIWVTYGKISLPTPVAWFITFNFINATWVFFRAESFSSALNILKSMIGLNGTGPTTILFSKAQRFMMDMQGIVPDLFRREIVLWVIVFLIVTILFKNSNELAKKFSTSLFFLAVCVLLYAIGSVNLNGFSEFLYFNF